MAFQKNAGSGITGVGSTRGCSATRRGTPVRSFASSSNIWTGRSRKPESKYLPELVLNQLSTVERKCQREPRADSRSPRDIQAKARAYPACAFDLASDKRKGIAIIETCADAIGSFQATAPPTR
jgi:hypothetical protein